MLFSWCVGFNCGYLLEMVGQCIIYVVLLFVIDLWNIDQYIFFFCYYYYFFSVEVIYYCDDRLIVFWIIYEVCLFGLLFIIEIIENIFNCCDIYKIIFVVVFLEIDILCIEVNNYLFYGYYVVVMGENYIDI